MKNSPKAASSHYASGGSADIIFPFDPRDPAITMKQRQRMMHEMTHHIDWLKGAKDPSKEKKWVPSPGRTARLIVTPNPHSERNADYQDRVINAFVAWKATEIGIGKGMVDQP
jgi:hypothetical protein